MSQRGARRPKLIYTGSRKVGYDRGQFIARWREHAALGMRQPRWENISRYMHCDCIDDPHLTESNRLCDGVGLVWYKSETARERHIAEQHSRDIMQLDERNTFEQPLAGCSLLTEELVCKDTAPAILKLFVFWPVHSDGLCVALPERPVPLRLADRIALDDITGYTHNRPFVRSENAARGSAFSTIDEFSAAALPPLIDVWRIITEVVDSARVARFAFTRAVLLHDV